MSFDDLARRAADAVRRDTADSEPPPISKVASKHSRRNIASVAAAAFVLTAAAIGGAALTRPVPPTLPAPVATQPSSTTAPTDTLTPEPPATTAMRAAITGWMISYPGDWFRADSDLMPVLGWDSTTIATFPLRSGGDRCAQVPEHALRDLRAGDALVSVFFSGSAGGESAPRPPVFNDETFPESGPTDIHECAERPDLEIHWGGWDFEGEHVYTLVAFGADVDEEVRATAWEALTSLDPVASTGEGHDCVVTLPGTLFAPTGPYPVQPAAERFAWYGTDDLWTVLPIDGHYVPTKSVWWSQNFDPQVSGEWAPDISVRYDRLDTSAAPVRSDGLGTNAQTAEDGWFMIANMAFAPPEAGCWRVTAEYKGATLSFVVNVPQEAVDS